MGQSRNNPLSPAYNGDLPDELVGGKITVQVEMSTEFQLRLTLWQQDPLNVGQEAPFKPTAADVFAVFYITGQLIRPSALIADRARWPSGEARMGELFRLPYSEFVERIEAVAPHLRKSQVEPSTGETKGEPS